MRAALVIAVGLAACAGSPSAPVRPVPAAAGSGSGSGAIAAGSGSSAAAGQAIWDQLHGEVASFQIVGGEDIDYLRLQPVFNDEVGKALDRVRLREKLERAMGGETLADVQITGEQLATGIRLVAHITPQPKVVTAALRDPTGQPIAVPPRLQEMVGARLAPMDLDHLVAELRAEYAEQGAAGYAVTWRTDAVAGGVALTVEANPGERLTISALVFSGAKGQRPAALEQALAKDVVVGAPWNPEVVERAALLVSSYYWDHGYANVTVKLAPQPEHNPAPVTFEIVEGDVFHLGKVEVAGVPADEAKVDLAVITAGKVKQGVLFSRAVIANARDALQNELVKRGHPGVVVQPLTKVDLPRKLITLTFEITLDPK